MTADIRIVAAAAPILLQDRGRPGFADIGVPTSGAFDRASAELAQRLVGNPPQTAGLEILLGNTVLRTERTVTVVVTGADTSIRVAGRAVAVNEVVSWPAGSDLELGTASRGLRTYLAVRGGFAAPPVLGSAATDVLSGLGPPPLRAGDTVTLALAPALFPLLSHTERGPDLRTVLRIRPGPRSSWFVESALPRLLAAQYLVAPDSNRIGLRLRGRPLLRAGIGELAPEPLQRGALQVPPDGLPIIMGPDHPTTGGYPVIAAVVSRDWDALAHLRPGDPVRFALDRQ